MGCDIHMYPEYRKRDSVNKYWRDFGGRINPGRNYYIFGLLSEGVRCDIEGAFEQRGLPNDLASESFSDARLMITSDGAGEGECTLEQAQRWKREITNDSLGNPRYVEHPDWHSHSWLTYGEFKEAMDKFNIAAEKEGNCHKELEYEAILAALAKLEELGQETRIVFWFDN